MKTRSHIQSLVIIRINVYVQLIAIIQVFPKAQNMFFAVVIERKKMFRPSCS